MRTCQRTLAGIQVSGRRILDAVRTAMSYDEASSEETDEAIARGCRKLAEAIMAGHDVRIVIEYLPQPDSED